MLEYRYEESSQSLDHCVFVMLWMSVAVVAVVTLSGDRRLWTNVLFYGGMSFERGLIRYKYLDWRY